MDVSFKDSEGNKLVGVLSDPGKTRAVVVMCHGFTSSKESITYKTMEQLLNAREIATLRFDTFGHGDSEGKFEDVTATRAVDGVLKAIGFVKRKGYSKVGLMGSSFGGLASIIAASQTPDLFALVLQYPVSHYPWTTYENFSKEKMGEWKKKGVIKLKGYKDVDLKLKYSFIEDFKNNDGYAAASKIKAPTLIIHGDKDESVPLEQSVKTAALIPDCTLNILRGAGHAKDEFIRVLPKLAEFIEEHS